MVHPASNLGSRFVSVAATVFVLAVTIVIAFPFYWMISSSVKPSWEMFASPPVLIPTDLHFENFSRVFTIQPFANQYINSLYIATLSTIGAVCVSTLAGYAFARLRFPGRTILLVVLLSALLMPIQSLMIPLYILFREVGWLGTHLPLIVMPAFGPPSIVGTFVMRQFFLSLPPELEDAARIDGLGRLGIIRHIAFPLARPAVASVVILTFLASWGSFIEPLVFVSGPPSMVTIPVGLTMYVDIGNVPIWEVQMAATTLAVLPVLIVFAFAQRAFVQGIATVGIRG